MASKSRALLLSLPPLAKRLRQMGEATVIAASLLLLAAEASAQAPLVTIQTWVVGTGQNPYSTVICTQNCDTNSVLTVYPATGSGPGYHVVALNRATLALVLNNTYRLNLNSLNSMNNDIAGLGNNVLVIITSIGPHSAIPAQAVQFLANVATNLGGTGPNYMYCPGFFTPGVTSTPVAYSLIGVPASGAPATQISTCANPDTGGNISGALVQDINMNYAFVYSTFVTIETMTGSQNDTIMIGTTPFEAPPLPAGTPGGFHLLVVKRTTLDRIKTDPTVVFLNTSYATNSSDTITAANESDRMLMDLNRFPNGIATGELIFVISSLGSAPGFNFNSFEVLSDFAQIDSIIRTLGGAGGLNNLSFNGFYSLIGIPNSGDPTLSPEVRSWVTPVVSGKPVLAGNITAVLQQNNVGVFTPVRSSAFPKATLENGRLDFSLYSAAYAEPTQWPAAANKTGSELVCPTGDQQCAAAYKWISWQILCNGNLACTNEDVRGHYNDLNLSLPNSVSYNYPRQQPTTNADPPAGFVFSKTVFDQVLKQLNIELTLVDDVQSFFKNNVAAEQGSAILNQLNLATTYMNVRNDVQLPPSMSVSPVNVLGVLRDALMVGQIIAGGVEPEVVPAFAAMNALIYLGMQFNNTPAGASNNQILSTYANLESDITKAFTSGLAEGGVLENLVLSDWNRLNTVGTNLENAKPGGAWYINGTTVPIIAMQMANSFTVSFYQALMPAAYQIVYFSNVPFSDPSTYCYLLDPSQGPSVTPYNEPPSGAFTILPTSSGTDYIWLAASPPAGSGIQNFSYPSNALMSKLFCGMNLYYNDFFMSQRGWGVMARVLPEGWTCCFQVSGQCPSTASGRSFHGRLPGATLSQKLFTPHVVPAVRAQLAAAASIKKKPPGNPGNPYCSLSR
jgi:hypothetical protein